MGRGAPAMAEEALGADEQAAQGARTHGVEGDQAAGAEGRVEGAVVEAGDEWGESSVAADQQPPLAVAHDPLRREADVAVEPRVPEDAEAGDEEGNHRRLDAR